MMKILWSGKSFIRSLLVGLLPTSFVLIIVSMTGLGKNDIFLAIIGSVLLLTAIACGLGAVTNTPEPTGDDTTIMGLNMGDFYPAGCVVFLVLALIAFCGSAGLPL